MRRHVLVDNLNKIQRQLVFELVDLLKNVNVLLFFTIVRAANHVIVHFLLGCFLLVSLRLAFGLLLADGNGADLAHFRDHLLFLMILCLLLC